MSVRNLLITLIVFQSVFSAGCAEKTEKVYRIGILSGVDAFLGVADSFKKHMKEFGYVEGKNVVYELKKFTLEPAGEKRAAQKFADAGVDLIFAFPTSPALAAKSAVQGTGIPVVFALGGTEGTNLVDSNSKPGGNVTGVRTDNQDLTVKRLEILLELLPSAKRIWVPYDINYPMTATTLQALRPAAAAANVDLIEVPVTSVAEIAADLKSRESSGTVDFQAITILPDILSHSPAAWSYIRPFAEKHRLPIAGVAPFTVDYGAVFSYSPTDEEVGRQSALLADKILKGTPAGSLLVITPRPHLRLNYKLANALQLNVSENILNRADEILR